MLKLDEFYDDGEILHKMRRADREAAREMEEDDEEEQAPRGTQATRPEELEDDEESEAVSSRKSIARVKKERQSRGQSSAPRRAARSPDVEMDDE
jgi:GAF domain-containing protein